MSIKFNTNPNEPFAEYDEDCYRKERENTYDLCVAAEFAYSQYVQNPTDENLEQFDTAGDRVIDEIFRLYDERAALIRIILNANDAALKKEYNRLIAESEKNKYPLDANRTDIV